MFGASALPAGAGWSACRRWVENRARIWRPPGARESQTITGEEDLPMALYLYQAAYTAESVVAQIKEPQDRI
jgi:hypothetical protein